MLELNAKDLGRQGSLACPGSPQMAVVVVVVANPSVRSLERAARHRSASSGTPDDTAASAAVGILAYFAFAGVAGRKGVDNLVPGVVADRTRRESLTTGRHFAAVVRAYQASRSPAEVACGLPVVVQTTHCSGEVSAGPECLPWPGSKTGATAVRLAFEVLVPALARRPKRACPRRPVCLGLSNMPSRSRPSR